LSCCLLGSEMCAVLVLHNGTTPSATARTLDRGVRIVVPSPGRMFCEILVQASLLPRTYRNACENMPLICCSSAAW
jgi:hypothetical protein